MTSELARLELRRAHHRLGRTDGTERTDLVLASCAVIALDATVLTAAAELPDRQLGSLDAIHLATALGVASELDALVTHDAMLAATASEHGFEVLTPT